MYPINPCIFILDNQYRSFTSTAVGQFRISAILIKKSLYDLRFSKRWCMKISFFWDIMPCSPLKINQLCGGNGSQQHQDREVNKLNSACYLLRDGFLLAFFFDAESGGVKRRLTFNGLQGL
jgi:hypothetical protein